MLLKDSDNGEQIVLKRKKDIFKKIVSWKKKQSEIGGNCQRCSIEIGGKCEEGQKEKINVLETVK